jgi:hypothetical protein
MYEHHQPNLFPYLIVALTGKLASAGLLLYYGYCVTLGSSKVLERNIIISLISFAFIVVTGLLTGPGLLLPAPTPGLL